MPRPRLHQSLLLKNRARKFPLKTAFAFFLLIAGGVSYAVYEVQEQRRYEAIEHNNRVNTLRLAEEKQRKASEAVVPTEVLEAEAKIRAYRTLNIQLQSARTPQQMEQYSQLNDDASAACDRAIAVHPNHDPRIYLWRAGMGRTPPEQCIRLCDKAIAISKRETDRADAYAMRSFLKKQYSVAGAEDDSRTALAIAPTAFCYLQAALLKEQNKELDEAVSYMRKSIELDPSGGFAGPYLYFPVPILERMVKKSIAPPPSAVEPPAQHLTGAIAQIQTFDSKRVTKEVRGSLRYGIRFTAQVKFLRTGTCTVRAGYWKDGKWHRGGISGKDYFVDEYVRGTTGDTVPVEIDCYESPPLNNDVHCDVIN